MHKLVRNVRFSINPFLSKAEKTPARQKSVGEGLSIFFELSTELTGRLNPKTGFVINTTEIANLVRQNAIPLFTEQISENFRAGKHVGIAQIVQLLKLCWAKLGDKFGGVTLSKLSVSLSPFRKVAIDSEDCKMAYFSEKFEFAATHKLWNSDYSEQENFKFFGKCANPTGHGHNYVVEMVVKIPEDNQFSIGGFCEVVEEDLMKQLDHKNLNEDVPYFGRVIPTMENIAVFAWDTLAEKLKPLEIHCVKVWETDRTYCSYYGPEEK